MLNYVLKQQFYLNVHFKALNCKDAKKIDKYFTWEAVCCENCMHGFSESVAVVKQPFDSLPIYRKC